MRSQLLHCLVECELSQFPRSDGNNRKCIHKIVSIALFCNGRMAWVKSDNGLFDKQMVKFDGCCDWFHRMSERIPEKPFNEKYIKCYCRYVFTTKKSIVFVVFILSKHSRDKKNTFKCIYSIVTPTVVGNAPSKNCPRNFMTCCKNIYDRVHF